MSNQEYYNGGQQGYYPPQGEYKPYSPGSVDSQLRAGPPPGQGGYYPQQPQQAYQGGYPQQPYGQPYGQPGYQPQPPPQTVYV